MYIVEEQNDSISGHQDSPNQYVSTLSVWIVKINTDSNGSCCYTFHRQDAHIWENINPEDEDYVIEDTSCQIAIEESLTSNR